MPHISKQAIDKLCDMLDFKYVLHRNQLHINPVVVDMLDDASKMIKALEKERDALLNRTP